MSRFKAMVFIKIGLKLSPFCKKCKIFQWLGAMPLDLEWPLAAGSAIRPPKQPLIADFWLRAWLRYFNDTTLVCWCFCKFQILSKYRKITNNLKTHQNIITNFGRDQKYFKLNVVRQNYLQDVCFPLPLFIYTQLNNFWKWTSMLYIFVM